MAGTYNDGKGHSLPYRLFIPAGYDASKQYPLVLYFHGAGGRGTDNLRQMTDVPRFLVLAEPANQQQWPCFILAPQCPENQMWAAMSWSEPTGVSKFTSITWPMEASLALLDSLQQEFFGIDVSRLYVTGISMGGYGTWDAICRVPNKFNAAVPICGGGDPVKIAQMADLRNLRVWAFHSADDPVVPVGRTREMIDALIALQGIQPRYTEYPDGGHDAYTRAYADTALLPWLFADDGSAAGSFFWTNTVSGAWSGAANWTNDTGAFMVPFTSGQTNYSLSFIQAGTVTANNDLGSGFLLNQLNFGGDTVTLAGNSLAFTNNAAALPQINQNSSAAVTVNNNLVLGTNVTFGGSGTGTVTVAGAMSGAGSLTKTGAGTLTLSAALTYSGATVISGGVLKLQGTTLKTLISAQFESAGGSVMSGNEALAAAADPAFSSSGTWNQLLLPAYSSKITNPSFSGLKDRGTGLATGIGFSINGGGIVSGFNNAWTSGNKLTKNIMIFGDFNGMSTGFNWQFSGLTPWAPFKLELYGSAATVANCGAFQTVDTNGDGSLNESPVTVIGTTPVLFTGTVGSTGLILGHADFAGTQGDWSGFQLYYEEAAPDLVPITTALSIAAGATFDVSAITNCTLGASASLTASGTGTAAGTDAAAIQGNPGGTVDLGSRPVTLAFTPASFSGDTAHPALVVPQGALTLNGALTVNIGGGTPLGEGTYRLISQTGGSISGTPILAATTGPGSNNGLASGAVAVLEVADGQVNLVVAFIGTLIMLW